MAEELESLRRKRDRSPSYPAIGLEEAIMRARTLYENERRNWAPADAAVEGWGYTTSSGLGRVVLAALKKFGLIEDKGIGPNRRVRLSDAGLKLVLDLDEDLEERRVALQETALSPTIHQELWQQYQDGLPSDNTLKRELLLQRGFTERAVSEFIPQFRQTLEFAGLTGNGGALTRSIDKTSPQDESLPMNKTVAVPEMPRRQIVPAPGDAAYTMPISAGREVAFRAPFPLSEAEWGVVEGWLHMIKSTQAIQSTVAPLSDMGFTSDEQG